MKTLQDMPSEDAENAGKLDLLLWAENSLREILMKKMKSIMDSSSDNMKFDLKELYVSFGIPTDFMQRRTLDVVIKLETLHRMMDKILRENGLQKVLGYGNLSDNDTFTLKPAEIEFLISQSKYDQLTTPKNVAWIKDKVNVYLGF